MTGGNELYIIRIMIKRLAGLWEVLRVLIVVFLMAFVVQRYVAQPFQVEGRSMEPSYHSGQLILIEKVSYRLHQPKRGDVVVFRYPNSPATDYIKRVIGLPGEKITITNGLVFVDGIQLGENYLSAGTQTFLAGSRSSYEITLGNDQYFMLGDNRTQSSDSRDWGPLDKKYMIGRLVATLNSSNTQAAISPSN